MLRKPSAEVMALVLLVMLTPKIKTDASRLTLSTRMSLFVGPKSTSASGDSTRV